MNNKEALYQEFIKNFPNFKPMVKAYYSHGDNALKIYTKQGKSFIFEKTDSGIELHSI